MGTAAATASCAHHSDTGRKQDRSTDEPLIGSRAARAWPISLVGSAAGA